MKKTRGIVIVGSSNTDMVIRVERIPRAGETILGGDFYTAAGGKGANQAVAAARAGGRVALVARLGIDTFGDQSLAGWASDDINVDHVTRDAHAPSGAALIFVARNGENSIAVAGGANSRLSATDVRKAAPIIRKSEVLLTQLETSIESVIEAARIAKASGTLVILNPAPARKLPKKLLELVSVLTPNETEAEILTGIRVDGLSAAAKAAQRLRRTGVGTVVITLGSKGAYWATGTTAGVITGFKAKVVDTTAAGDVFNGALAVALSEGQSLEQAIRFANAAASISVTRRGAQPSAPKRVEIERLLKSAE